MLARVARVSAADAVHAVALFSTATPVPAEHTAIPVFPDEEDGTVEHFYADWRALLHMRERGRAEHSHPGFGPHVHSHIKLVAARRPRRGSGHGDTNLLATYAAPASYGITCAWVSRSGPPSACWFSAATTSALPAVPRNSTRSE